MPVSELKRHWALTPQAFDQLLAKLDENRDAAGSRYETLRRSLIFFFRSRGVRPAEEHADETLDRVSRRLDEGVGIRNLAAYVAGIARIVARESQREGKRRREALQHFPDPLPEEELSRAEARSRCLEQCLSALPEGERELILRYCQGDWAERVRSRRRLARQLGVRPAAMRLRIHRIRARLERCVADCMRQQMRETRGDL